MIKFSISPDPKIVVMSLRMDSGKAEVTLYANDISLLTISQDGDIVRKTITQKDELQLLKSWGFRLDNKSKIFDWSA
jgi:hypothetical protein